MARQATASASPTQVSLSINCLERPLVAKSRLPGTFDDATLPSERYLVAGPDLHPLDPVALWVR